MPGGTEAIRPADIRSIFQNRCRWLSPDEFALRHDLETDDRQPDERRPRPPRHHTIEADGGLQASGKTIEFAGYLRAYVKLRRSESDLADREETLPPVSVGETLQCAGIEPKSHRSRPIATARPRSPGRLDMGIGRPSTYVDHRHHPRPRLRVQAEASNVLVPTWTAFAVSQLLEEHLPEAGRLPIHRGDGGRTGHHQRGEMSHLDYLRMFYFGNEHPGLKQLLQDKASEIDARSVCQISLGKPQGQGERAAEIFVRVGRYGPFLEQAERRASLPDKLPPDELTLETALEMLEKAQQSDEPLGLCPDTHKPVFVKVGRFGPYVQRGAGSDDEKPQNASLLKDMDPAHVTLEIALKLLSLPRTLGQHPQTGEPVVAHNGRFGPYGSAARRRDPCPTAIRRWRLLWSRHCTCWPAEVRAAAVEEPAKVFDASPVTGQPVRLMQGRYGPYVSDG